MDGWKMQYYPFKMIPFQGHSLIFGGLKVCQSIEDGILPLLEKL